MKRVTTRESIEMRKRVLAPGKDQSAEARDLWPAVGNDDVAGIGGDEAENADEHTEFADAALIAAADLGRKHRGKEQQAQHGAQQRRNHKRRVFPASTGTPAGRARSLAERAAKTSLLSPARRRPKKSPAGEGGAGGRGEPTYLSATRVVHPRPGERPRGETRASVTPCQRKDAFAGPGMPKRGLRGNPRPGASVQ